MRAATEQIEGEGQIAQGDLQGKSGRQPRPTIPGERVKEIRLKLNLSLRGLATVLGYDPVDGSVLHRLSDYERGHKTVPQLFARVMELLDANPSIRAAFQIDEASARNPAEISYRRKRNQNGGQV
jgi:hypothetical protein